MHGPTRKQFNNFNKSVAATPLDASLRLVFADWLEEQGLDSAAAEQRLLGTLLNDPHDTRARWEYANWLDSRKRSKEACLHRWIVLLFKGKDPHPLEEPLLVTRQGAFKPDLSSSRLLALADSESEPLRRRAEDLLRTHADAHLVVVDDSDPADFELETDDRAEGAAGEVRSPVLYLWDGPDIASRICGVPSIEDGSLCPYCMWDALGNGARRVCKHLVCALEECSDDFAGIIAGAALEGVADEALRSLADTVKGFVRSCHGDRKKIRSLKPKHLRPLTKAVVEEYGLDPEEEEDEELDVAMAIQYAFNDYLCAVFCRVEKNGKTTCFDTGYPEGVCPLMCWSTDARGTAKKIKRQITEDLAAVSQQTQ
jgi:uncharacterized protein (TIGR02996 family)